MIPRVQCGAAGDWVMDAQTVSRETSRSDLFELRQCSFVFQNQGLCLN